MRCVQPELGRTPEERCVQPELGRTPDCPTSRMVAGLDSQERHHPGWQLTEFGGVDDGEWRELMMWKEGVDGLKKGS